MVSEACPMEYLNIDFFVKRTFLVFIVAACTSQSHLIGTPTNAHT